MRLLEILRDGLGLGEGMALIRLTPESPRTSRVVPPPFPAPTITFPVSEVELATAPLREIPYRTAIEHQLTPPPSPFTMEERRLIFGGRPGPLPLQVENPSPVEACCSYRGRLVAAVYSHPFMAAVHAAFADHRPLVLSPDMIWLLLMQGFAHHVEANAETLRPRFVQHAGKTTLRVRRDDFVKGSPENPWEEVFDAFSGGVRQHIGAETHDLLLPTFTTTGELERAAAQVVLLGAMRTYFDYSMTTFCGIPTIALEGTPEDWDLLATRTRAFGQFGLEWWVGTLLPVLNQFSAAARGEVDGDFWRSIYKDNDDSGGPYLTGWVAAFFPYLVEKNTGHAAGRNAWLDSPAWKEGSPQHRFGGGPTMDELPSGLSRVAFRWDYLKREFDMEFIAGFTGIRQDGERLALRPEIGWAVRDGAPRGGEVIGGRR